MKDVRVIVMKIVKRVVRMTEKVRLKSAPPLKYIGP
jgi:hypothetical protein